MKNIVTSSLLSDHSWPAAMSGGDSSTWWDGPGGEELRPFADKLARNRGIVLTALGGRLLQSSPDC